MHPRCVVCELKFEREPGHFLGAMYISNGLGLAIITVLCIVIWGFSRWPFEKNVIGALVLFLPLAPTVSRWSRVLWIYFDRAIDPE